MSASRQSARLEPPGFGEPAPFFTAETDGNPAYSIQVAAGRWLVLMVFASLETEEACLALTAILARGRLFDDTRAAFFGISADPADQSERGLHNAAYGLRYFWDFDQRACAALGLAAPGRPRTRVFLIDPAFRIVMAEPIARAAEVMDRLELALAEAPAAGDAPFAPVLTLPRIFEPDFCRRLIETFEAGEAAESGFAAHVDGHTRTVVNPALKRRRDVTVEDAALTAAIRLRIEARLMPMIKTAFGWRGSGIERFLIGRYAAEDRGFFFAHRDDAVPGAEHRRFAVTVNLNAEDHEGGELRFPEFGPRTYRPPTGGATVFCCSLLHEVTPVTRGVRYAFLPFLYGTA